MAQGRLPDGLCVSGFVVVLLVAVHFIRVAGVAAAQAFGQHTAQDKVQRKAHRNGVHHLDDHEHRQLVPISRHGYQQRDGFVTGSKVNSHQGAQRDDAGGIEVGRNGRKAALRHTAQHCARNRAPAAASGQQRFDALAMAGLNVFDQKISQKQEGQHLGGIHQRFAQDIQKQFHIHSKHSRKLLYHNKLQPICIFEQG